MVRGSYPRGRALKSLELGLLLEGKQRDPSFIMDIAVGLYRYMYQYLLISTCFCGINTLNHWTEDPLQIKHLHHSASQN